MNTEIYDYLARDHCRLDGLLKAASAPVGTVEQSSYAAFRAGLLRHIGIEEKILVPAARRAQRGVPLPVATQLRRDHASLAALLVPTPTSEILYAIRTILERHNELEEQTDGLYMVCEALLADEHEHIVAQLRNAPEVPVAPHFDGPRVTAHIEALLKNARNPRS